MIAGLPWSSWLLLLVAVGTGLVIEVAFFRAHRRSRRGREDADRRPDRPPRDGGNAR